MIAAPSGDMIDTMLSIIPSLPRTVLDRLVTNMIDRMDELDGNTDLEDDEREPELYFHGPASLQLPGVRGRNSNRVRRLYCERIEVRRRHRPYGHHWRRRVRH